MHTHPPEDPAAHTTKSAGKERRIQVITDLSSDGGRYVRTNKSDPSQTPKVYVGLFFVSCWAFSIFFSTSSSRSTYSSVSQHVNTSVRGKGNNNWWEVDQPLLENWPHPIKTRTDIGKYLNLLQLKRGVEVAVQRERFDMRTLSQWVVCETYKIGGFVWRGSELQRARPRFCQKKIQTIILISYTSMQGMITGQL